MKDPKANSIWISALLLMTCSGSQRAETTQDATIGDSISITGDNWCPYACAPESGQPGILVEIVSEIFEQEGISVKYNLMPWRRALIQTQRGGSDAILGVVQGNRDGLLLDKHGMGIDETVIVLRKGSDFRFDGPRSLDSLSLGIIANYTYDNNGELDLYLKERRRIQDRIVTIYRDEPIKSLINMLRGNRIDAFFENRQVIHFESNRLDFKDEIRVIGTGLGDTIHVGFTPNSRGRKNLDIYHHGFQKMLKSGRVEEIVKQYGLEYVPTYSEIPLDNKADK